MADGNVQNFPDRLFCNRPRHLHRMNRIHHILLRHQVLQLPQKLLLREQKPWMFAPSLRKILTLCSIKNATNFRFWERILKTETLWVCFRDVASKSKFSTARYAFVTNDFKKSWTTTNANLELFSPPCPLNVEIPRECKYITAERVLRTTILVYQTVHLHHRGRRDRRELLLMCPLHPPPKILRTRIETIGRMWTNLKRITIETIFLVTGENQEGKSSIVDKYPRVCFV